MQFTTPDPLPEGLTLDRVYEYRAAQKRENLKGAISLASDTLKALLVLNGGAAAGLLTFYGNVITKAVTDEASAHRLGQAIEVAGIQNALAWFAGGAGAAVLACAVAYIAQLKVAVQYVGEPNEPGAARPLRALAMIVSLCSAAAFVIGIMSAAAAFR